MGARGNIHLLAVLTYERIATFGARSGRECVVDLYCAPEEAVQFECVLSSRPFGASQLHVVFLHGLKQAQNLSCCLRVSAAGSRLDKWIAVCAETYEGLEFVFNQFALDPELVPVMPPQVRESTANRPLHPTAFGVG